MKASPTSRTLQYLRGFGLRSQVVEKWIPRANVRQDLFGVIDVVSLWPKNTAVLQIHGIVLGYCEIIGWQACAGASHAARKAKMLASEGARDWCRAGGVLLLISWSKKGARGKRKRWEPRVERIEL